MFENKEGQTIPDVTFRVYQDNEWANITTADVFSNRKVIVFSLPGAFTPTCSSAHVPRFNQLANTFRENGVDEIVCVSVNDTFVMNEWSADQNAENITFLPDGNGEFTDGMGLLVDKTDLGFGKRSWRYSMLVNDGIIEKMFIEPDLPGDPFEVSDADTMLEYVAPDNSVPASVSVFTRPGCAFCAKAKSMLKEAGYDYEELLLNRDYTDLTLRAVSNTSSVPQVFINGELIGGAEQLEKWLAK
jgi:glutaredoxin-like protein